MAQVVWSEPAISDLDAIADFIALENEDAAKQLVRRVFKRVERLAQFPDHGSRPPELPKTRYRQVVLPPCRIFCRHDADQVIILHVMRSEQALRTRSLR